jgi:hypothetical protein
MHCVGLSRARRGRQKCPTLPISKDSIYHFTILEYPKTKQRTKLSIIFSDTLIMRLEALHYPVQQNLPHWQLSYVPALPAVHHFRQKKTNYSHP